jgi:hypothetical protein
MYNHHFERIKKIADDLESELDLVKMDKLDLSVPMDDVQMLRYHLSMLEDEMNKDVKIEIIATFEDLWKEIERKYNANSDDYCDFVLAYVQKWKKRLKSLPAQGTNQSPQSINSTN